MPLPSAVSLPYCNRTTSNLMATALYGDTLQQNGIYISFFLIALVNFQYKADCAYGAVDVQLCYLLSASGLPCTKQL